MALPLMASNLFQQLYNTVDAIFVGKYVGSEALAAVGTSGYIVYILIYFFMGLSIGASIIVSHGFGSKDHRKVYEAVHTTGALSLISGLILMIVGILLCPVFLKWMNVPQEVFPFAVTYLRIYFCGMIPMLIYNMGSGILRAVGDTKIIMYSLIASCGLNIVLEYLMVGIFSLGIAGAAWASVLSQILSASIMVIRLVRSKEAHRLIPREIRFYKKPFQSIVHIGGPTGLQSVLQCFSNIYIQSRFNLFGAGVMAGVTAFGKIEGFIYMPIEGFAMAACALVGQNIGAKQYKKVRQVVKSSMVLCAGVTIVICLAIYWTAPRILSLFSSKEEVLQNGLDMLYTVTPLYFIYGMNQIFGGVIRGTGQSRVPMTIILICTCAFRILWSFVVSSLWKDTYMIYISYPLSWILTWSVFCIYYFRGNWLKKYENLSNE